MEIRLCVEEVEQIIAKYFQERGYKFITDNDTKSVEFQEENCDFSIITDLPEA